MNPEVSVVMSVYNGQEFLGEAIESILAQSWSDFEFIIIDDGSTDNSAGVIESYKDPRIHCIRNECNRGLAWSLNAGIARASGRYVARMDADDRSLPERLSRQVNFLKSHPTVAVCGGWIEVVGSGVRQVWEYPTTPQGIHARLLFDCSMAHPTVMLDRAHWNKARLSYDSTYSYAQDYELWCRAVHSISLANLPEVLLIRRLHSEQIGQRRGPAQQEGARRIRRRELEQLGLAPTEQQCALHESISTWSWPRTDSFVRDAEVWLCVLRRANDARARYPEPEFSRVIGERWAEIVRSLDPALGRRFWTSPLRDAVDLGGKNNVLGRAWRGLSRLGIW